MQPGWGLEPRVGPGHPSFAPPWPRASHTTPYRVAAGSQQDGWWGDAMSAEEPGNPQALVKYRPVAPPTTSAHRAARPR